MSIVTKILKMNGYPHYKIKQNTRDVIRNIDDQIKINRSMSQLLITKGNDVPGPHEIYEVHERAARVMKQNNLQLCHKPRGELRDRMGDKETDM